MELFLRNSKEQAGNNMISIILPSLNRVPGLLRGIRNLRESTQVKLEIVVVLNHDDKASHVAIDQLENKDGIKVVTMPSDCPKGRSQRCYQAGYEAASGPWFSFGADDFVYKYGWAAAALSCPNKGFVAFNEPHWGSDLACQWMATKEYIDTVMGGYFGLTYYYKQWSDNEIKIRARLAGRYAYCPEAIVEHLDPAFTGKLLDENAELSKLSFGEDQATYKAREAAGFPVNWPTV